MHAGQQALGRRSESTPPPMSGAAGLTTRAQRLACTKADGLIGTAGASRAGTAAPAIRWRITQANQSMLATLVYEATVMVS